VLIDFVGPAPKCTVAARTTRTTHRGVNELLVRARVGDKVLERGKYLLRLTFASGKHARRGLDVLPRRMVRALPAKAIALDCEPPARPAATAAALASFPLTPFPPTPKLPEIGQSRRGAFIPPPPTPPPPIFSVPGGGHSQLTSALLIAATAAALILGLIGAVVLTGRLLRRISR
jgi:hypothetical protein